MFTDRLESKESPTDVEHKYGQKKTFHRPRIANTFTDEHLEAYRGDEHTSTSR